MLRQSPRPLAAQVGQAGTGNRSSAPRRDGRPIGRSSSRAATGRRHEGQLDLVGDVAAGGVAAGQQDTSGSAPRLRCRSDRRLERSRLDGNVNSSVGICSEVCAAACPLFESVNWAMRPSVAAKSASPTEAGARISIVGNGMAMVAAIVLSEATRRSLQF